MSTRKLTAIALCCVGAATARAQDPEVEKLRQDVAELQRRLAEIEQRPGVQLGTPPQAPQSPVEQRDSLDDRQTPAPRLDNLSLDPEMQGFFPVFGSPVLLKFNAKPRLDAMYDNRETNGRFRFIPSKFPVPGQPEYGGGAQFNLNANATQFSVDVRNPDSENGFRFYYQNDFFASDTSNMKYRLQHAYGQTHNIVAGFTYGLFEDPDIWPDTVDYEGPNALVFARRPVLHYMIRFDDEWYMTLGIEQPDMFLENSFDPTASLNNRAPDTGFNVRYERRDVGHVQASAIFRSIGVKGAAIDEQYEFAWGANISTLLEVTEVDDLGILLVGGRGIGGMGNDTSFLNSDGALDATGDLVALPYYSVMVTYRHEWSEAWRSTATYGFASLEGVAGQAPETFEKSHYASANLIHRFARNASVGLEVLYGRKEVRDGRIGDAVRVQLGLVYSIF